MTAPQRKSERKPTKTAKSAEAAGISGSVPPRKRGIEETAEAPAKKKGKSE